MTRGLDAGSPAVSRRMQRVRRRDTGFELAIRKRLHAMGYRFLVDHSPISTTRTRPDLCFRGARVAVYLDSCYWHGCPLHGTVSGANADWWAAKMGANRARDLKAVEALTAAGWTALRIWEHLGIDDAIFQITVTLARRSEASPGSDESRAP